VEAWQLDVTKTTSGVCLSTAVLQQIQSVSHIVQLCKRTRFSYGAINPFQLYCKIHIPQGCVTMNTISPQHIVGYESDTSTAAYILHSLLRRSESVWKARLVPFLCSSEWTGCLVHKYLSYSLPIPAIFTLHLKVCQWEGQCCQC